MGAILGWSFFGLVLSLTLGVAAAQFVCNPDDPRFERKDDPEGGNGAQRDGAVGEGGRLK